MNVPATWFIPQAPTPRPAPNAPVTQDATLNLKGYFCSSGYTIDLENLSIKSCMTLYNSIYEYYSKKKFGISQHCIKEISLKYKYHQTKSYSIHLLTVFGDCLVSVIPRWGSGLGHRCSGSLQPWSVSTGKPTGVPASYHSSKYILFSC